MNVLLMFLLLYRTAHAIIDRIEIDESETQTLSEPHELLEYAFTPYFVRGQEHELTNVREGSEAMEAYK